MKNKIEHILIVDDEVDICFLLKSILKRSSNAKIDICNSVSCALKKLEKGSYDLAFFDMRLNDGTGVELIQFANNMMNQKPYIAVISAYSSEIDLERLKQLNINEFIPKPLSTEKIEECYRAACA